MHAARRDPKCAEQVRDLTGGGVDHAVELAGAIPAMDTAYAVTRQGGQVVTAGGRVLCVTALGENVKLAQKAAYEAAAQIAWDGLQYRKDIGYRAISR